MSKPPLHLRTRLLISEDDIASRVNELGNDISEFYDGEPLTMVVIMNGAMIFGADLARAITLPIWLDSIRTSSYKSFESSGKVEFASNLKLPVVGRHILIVDDILDSGLTLARVKEKISELGPLSIRTCVMLDKQVTRTFGGMEQADWSGFKIKPHFAIGYGLDVEEYWRNQSDISIVEES